MSQWKLTGRVVLGLRVAEIGFRQGFVGLQLHFALYSDVPGYGGQPLLGLSPLLTRLSCGSTE